jgi:ribosome-binding factor A
MVRQQKRYPRTARLNETVLEALADELERMNDPRLEMVTLTGVDVSRDLSHASVYYSTLAATSTGASETFAEDAADALARAAPHFRGLLGRQLRIRQVPKLVFKIDPGIVAGQRIEEILRDIHHDDAQKEQAGDQ